MAYNFHSGKMYSDQLDAALAGAVFTEDVKNGSFCVLGDLAPDTTYAAAGDFEYDVYEAAAPTAVTNEVVVVDYAGISEGEIAGNNYKMGIKLYDLTVPAGTITRVRRLHLHDKFWLAKDNFTSAPTVGEYAVIDATKYTLAPASSVTSGFAVKVLVKKDLTAGMSKKDDNYLVEVVAL